ncbi:ArsR/SmtB family transcription factor [Amycolatopsis tolypomycina]|uniref:ArsR/SmtB family transcription factor n=1 Tax=Amycolatopsis tolypomycina TaxID=208445 RepID=UPI000B84DF39|nr:metalloregulator ArsR/SmtB family transcription factor [Amycolatopsis tolypomycina]
MRNGVPTAVSEPETPRPAAAESVAPAAADSVECAPHCSVPLNTPRLSHDEATQLSSVFKALAHPTRVQLMNLLLGSRFAVCAYDLQVAMGMPQSTISHHLKLLVGSGLVHRQQRGIWAYFSINTDAMRALGLVINLDDAAPQPLSPAALRDPAVEQPDEAL